jgi:hypothetical protein
MIGYVRSIVPLDCWIQITTEAVTKTKRHRAVILIGNTNYKIRPGEIVWWNDNREIFWAPSCEMEEPFQMDQVQPEALEYGRVARQASLALGVSFVNRASSNVFRAPPALPRRQMTRIFQVTSASANGRMTTPGKEKWLAKAGNIKTAFRWRSTQRAVQGFAPCREISVETSHTFSNTSRPAGPCRVLLESLR